MACLFSTNLRFTVGVEINHLMAFLECGVHREARFKLILADERIFLLGFFFLCTLLQCSNHLKFYESKQTNTFISTCNKSGLFDKTAQLLHVRLPEFITKLKVSQPVNQCKLSATEVEATLNLATVEITQKSCM